MIKFLVFGLLAGTAIIFSMPFAFADVDLVGVDIFCDPGTIFGFIGLIPFLEICPIQGISVVEVLFEFDEYSIGDYAKITVTDSTANLDSNQIDEVTVRVTSQTDPVGIDVILVEDSVDSGTFTSQTLVSFLTLSTDQTQVRIETNVGETVTVTYISQTDTAPIVSSPFFIFFDDIDPAENVLALSCTADDDGDGLCNDWEQPDGLRITLPNDVTYIHKCNTTADPICPDPNKKDVYVELDAKKNFHPLPGVIEAVQQEFDEHDITLHVILDELEITDFGPILPLNQTFGQDFFDVKKDHFGTLDERNGKNGDGTSGHNPTDLLTAKRQAFHYSLFVQQFLVGTIDNAAGVSDGTPGNDFLIAYTVVPKDFPQSVTFMHELGHNLGLFHGGNIPPDINNDGKIELEEISADNCKPNYPSIMSYSRQLVGILVNQELEYSDGKFISLDENSLVEAVGVGSEPAGVEIVWGPPPFFGEINRDFSGGSIDWVPDNILTTESEDINDFFTSPFNELIDDCDDTGLTTLTDHDDWNNLVFDFRRSGTFINGVIFDPKEYPEITREDILNPFLALVNQLEKVIEDLPDGAFVGDPNSSRDTLLDELSAIEDFISQDQLPDAFDNLIEFREKMDGSVGGDPNDDLIIESGAQAQTLELVDRLLSVLGEVIPPPEILTVLKDSFIKQGSAKDNEGANPILRIISSDKNRPVIEFNQDEISEKGDGRLIESATLRLFITDNGNNWGPDGRIISVNKLLESWEEGNGWNVGNNISGTGTGVTWNCAVDNDISNNQDDCSIQWDGGNFDSVPIDSVLITNDMINQWIELDVTMDVQAFIDGTINNFGWMVKKNDESQNGTIEFASKEAGSNIPELVIEFPA